MDRLLRLRKFLHDDSGAVTVDWVVLTASVIALGLLVLVIFYAGMNTATGAMIADLVASMTSAAGIN